MRWSGSLGLDWKETCWASESDWSTARSSSNNTRKISLDSLEAPEDAIMVRQLTGDAFYIISSFWICKIYPLIWLMTIIQVISTDIWKNSDLVSKCFTLKATVCQIEGVSNVCKVTCQIQQTSSGDHMNKNMYPIQHFEHRDELIAGCGV